MDSVRAAIHANSQEVLAIIRGRTAFDTIPRFQTWNIIPPSSRVFGVVKSGRVDDLLKMLSLREASLWDQDHLGRTLIFYANKSPEMCRFLLENGADADRVAPPVSCNHTRMTTPLEQSLNYFEAEAEELHRAVQCLELLLEAGSDPTWQPGWQMTVPAAILSSGVPEAIAVLLDCAGAQITPATIVNGYLGHTPLLSYCFGATGNPAYSADVLSILVRRGANAVEDRDWQGRTCLHLLFDGLAPSEVFETSQPRQRCAGSYLRQVREAADYLIDRGADIFARDYDGTTIFDIAYAGQTVTGCLLDLVLADFGYDVGLIRSSGGWDWRPYEVKRTMRGISLAESFTTGVFMDLWEGKEYLCPYYDDAIRWGFIGGYVEDSDSDDSDSEESDDDEDDDDGWSGMDWDDGDDGDDWDEDGSEDMDLSDSDEDEEDEDLDSENGIAGSESESEGDEEDEDSDDDSLFDDPPIWDNEVVFF